MVYHKITKKRQLTNRTLNKDSQRSKVSKYVRIILNGFLYALEACLIWLIRRCSEEYLSVWMSWRNFGSLESFR